MEKEANENDKRFTFTVTCYRKFLYGIENVSKEELLDYLKSLNEPKRPGVSWFEEGFSTLKNGETMQLPFQTNEGKLFGMLPEYHREANLKRVL
jgi:hypothetical protein